MNKSNGGIGIVSLSFIIFFTLKLCNIIGWSWWWVTAPLWGPIALGISFVIIIVLINLILASISSLFKGK